MVNFRETFVVIRNESIEVTPTEPISYPLYNFCAIKITPDGSGRNLKSIEGFYRYGQEEDEVIEVAMVDLGHLQEYIDNRGFTLQEKILRHTAGWSERDTAHLLKSLSMPNLEESEGGIAKEQVILDAFSASVGIYLAFTELTRKKEFWPVAPLPFMFSAPTDNSPFATGVLHHYLHPTRVCALIGQNEMGARFSSSVVDFVNIWGSIFKTTPLRHDLQPIISETVMGFEDYLLTQIQRASRATDTFDGAVEQMNLMLQQLQQQMTGGDHAVLTATMDRVSRHLDDQIARKVPSIVTTATSEVISGIKQSFQRYLSEVYRGYDKVLTDEIDDLAKKALLNFHLEVDKKVAESRLLHVETKKLHDDVALALKDLRGLPSELATVKKQQERLPSLERRIDALEAQISRLIAKLH